MILVSACLLGYKTKYDGGSNCHELLFRYMEYGQFLPICPEVAGGLPTPRAPVEIQGGTGDDVWRNKAEVCDKSGKKRTEAFRQGAKQVLALAQAQGASAAILKEHSPSCGVHYIYDGTFKKVKRCGRGVAAACLAAAGLCLYSEKEVTEALLQALLARERDFTAKGAVDFRKV